MKMGFLWSSGRKLCSPRHLLRRSRLGLLAVVLVLPYFIYLWHSHQGHVPLLPFRILNRPQLFTVLNQTYIGGINQTNSKSGNKSLSHPLQTWVNQGLRGIEKYDSHNKSSGKMFILSHKMADWVDPDASQVFTSWYNTKTDFCDGKVNIYHKDFVLMRDSVLDSSHFVSTRKGGEDMEVVMKQDEQVEYYSFNSGTFAMKCSQNAPLDFKFNENQYFTSMFQNTVVAKNAPSDVRDVKPEFYMLVIRYEYVNLFHTMTDWYNAFLVMKFFNRTSDQTNILIADTHPAGNLDPVWPTVFNSTIRVSELKPRTLFRELAWVTQGYKSIISPFPRQLPLPLHEEFRDFFLHNHGIPPHKHKLNCESVNVMFIWRRNYVAHPRNPSGAVARKITNEDELVSKLNKELPNCLVSGNQFDNLPMEKQLSLIATTDILIGMHGAGLSHTLFLPQTSGLIELNPAYPANAGIHFQNMAAWRNMPSINWKNPNWSTEDVNKWTSALAVNDIKGLIQDMLKRIKCDV